MRPDDANAWGRTLPDLLGRTYPYAAQHISRGPDDVDVTPDRLHPAFHGCFDWHSSVHMHWSAVRLLTVAADLLDDDVATGLATLLDARLTDHHVAAEAAYLRERPTFERPYGWGWAAKLAAETARCAHPSAPAWAAATRPLLDVVFDHVRAWLPVLAYPVRSGEHSNLAFGLALVHEAAGQVGRDDIVALVDERARNFYLGDRDAPVGWEPGGSDFLSPALSEADLMRRVLPAGEYAAWLSAFLPHLGAEDDHLLDVPTVLDRTDGKAVHLYGLALSRAWQLRGLARALAPDVRARVEAATARQVERVEREIVEGNFMATHWLVSFALLAEGP